MSRNFFSSQKTTNDNGKLANLEDYINLATRIRDLYNYLFGEKSEAESNLFKQEKCCEEIIQILESEYQNIARIVRKIHHQTQTELSDILNDSYLTLLLSAEKKFGDFLDQYHDLTSQDKAYNAQLAFTYFEVFLKSEEKIKILSKYFDFDMAQQFAQYRADSYVSQILTSWHNSLEKKFAEILVNKKLFHIIINVLSQNPIEELENLLKLYHEYKNVLDSDKSRVFIARDSRAIRHLLTMNSEIFSIANKIVTENFAAVNQINNEILTFIDQNSLTPQENEIIWQFLAKFNFANENHFVIEKLINNVFNFLLKSDAKNIAPLNFLEQLNQNQTYRHLIIEYSRRFLPKFSFNHPEILRLLNLANFHNLNSDILKTTNYFNNLCQQLIEQRFVASESEQRDLLTRLRYLLNDENSKDIFLKLDDEGNHAIDFVAQIRDFKQINQIISSPAFVAFIRGCYSSDEKSLDLSQHKAQNYVQEMKISLRSILKSDDKNKNLLEVIKIIDDYDFLISHNLDDFISEIFSNEKSVSFQLILKEQSPFFINEIMQYVYDNLERCSYNFAIRIDSNLDFFDEYIENFHEKNHETHSCDIKQNLRDIFDKIENKLAIILKEQTLNHHLLAKRKLYKNSDSNLSRTNRLRDYQKSKLSWSNSLSDILTVDDSSSNPSFGDEEDFVFSSAISQTHNSEILEETKNSEVDSSSESESESKSKSESEVKFEINEIIEITQPESVIEMPTINEQNENSKNSR